MGKKKQASSEGSKAPKTKAKSTPPMPPDAPVVSVPVTAEQASEGDKTLRIHYYVKIAVSTFLCALLLLIGVPVFMESRVTGSLAYTALGVVLVAFGLILALAVVILLFNPPFKARMSK